jgi:transposase
MFNEGGDGGLDPIPNAGGTSRMTDADRLKLSVLLRVGARMNGFATDLWALRRVRDVIEREFRIRYSISNVHNIVRGLGFSPQRPSGERVNRTRLRSLSSGPRRGQRLKKPAKRAGRSR